MIKDTTLRAAPADEPLNILCVDDDENILKMLVRVFRAEPFGVLTATSGEGGLAILKHAVNVGLILSDQQMPGMSGAAFLEKAKNIAPDIPRMMLTGHADTSAAIDAINQGGTQRFILKPWVDQEVRLAVRNGLLQYRVHHKNIRLNELLRRQKDELAEWNAGLKSRVLQQTALIGNKLSPENRRTMESQKSRDAIIRMFTDMLERRDPRLGKDSRNVAALAAAMAGTLNLPTSQIEEIRHAALLHNIGLISVPDTLLHKRRELLEGDEVAEYRSHAVRGEELVDVFAELRGSAGLIGHQYEEFNGNGFPDGLAGEQIPLGSRIISLAGFINHAYAPESGPDAKLRVARKLAAGMGTRFDPALSIAANLAMKAVLKDPSPPGGATVEQVLFLKELRAGMVLTRDIHTPNGLLIIKRGALNSDKLATIKSHGLSFPRNWVAYVEKPSSRWQAFGGHFCRDFALNA